MLGPNAVPQMDAYVPIIDKTVRAHVHDDVGIFSVVLYVVMRRRYFFSSIWLSWCGTMAQSDTFTSILAS